MKNSKAIIFLMATLAFDGIGIGLVFPIMPDLMERVGATSTADGAFLGGVLMASYAAMLFIFSPAIGALSDAIGRRPVLIAALATLVVDYIIMALATTYWVLLIGRILAGIAGATYVTATAYLADVSTKENRAANFGMIGAAYGLGFALGPMIGGVVATWSLSAPFWLAAVLAAVAVVFGIFVLPESLAPENRRAMSLRGLNPFTAILDALRLPGLLVPLAGLFVYEFANMVYPTLWVFWLRESFDWSVAFIGVSLTVYGIGLAATQGGLLRVLVPRLGEYRTLILAATCALLGFTAYGFARVEWLVFALMPLALLGDITPPTVTGMMSNMVDEDRQGMLQGVIASMGSISAVVAPLLLTWVFQIFASPDAPIYMPGAPFILSALMMLGVIPLFLRMRTR